MNFTRESRPLLEDKREPISQLAKVKSIKTPQGGDQRERARQSKPGCLIEGRQLFECISLFGHDAGGQFRSNAKAVIPVPQAVVVDLAAGPSPDPVHIQT